MPWDYEDLGDLVALLIPDIDVEGLVLGICAEVVGDDPCERLSRRSDLNPGTSFYHR